MKLAVLLSVILSVVLSASCSDDNYDDNGGSRELYAEYKCHQCHDQVQQSLEGYRSLLAAFKACCNQCTIDDPTQFPAANVPKPEGVYTDPSSVWADPVYDENDVNRNPDWMQAYFDAGACPPKKYYTVGAQPRVIDMDNRRRPLYSSFSTWNGY